MKFLDVVAGTQATKVLSSFDDSSPCRYIFWTTAHGYSRGHSFFLLAWARAHIWSSHLFYNRFLEIFEIAKSILFEAHSLDVLVSADDMFSGHRLLEGRVALLFPSFFAGAFLPGPYWKGKAHGLLMNWLPKSTQFCSPPMCRLCLPYILYKMGLQSVYHLQLL